MGIGELPRSIQCNSQKKNKLKKAKKTKMKKQPKKKREPKKITSTQILVFFPCWNAFIVEVIFVLILGFIVYTNKHLGSEFLTKIWVNMHYSLLEHVSLDCQQ